MPQLFWNGNIFETIKILTHKSMCIHNDGIMNVFGVARLLWLIWGPSICQLSFRLCAYCKVIQSGGSPNETHLPGLNGDRPVTLDFWVLESHEACWKGHGLHQLCTHQLGPRWGIIAVITEIRGFWSHVTGLARAPLRDAFPFLFLSLKWTQ